MSRGAAALAAGDSDTAKKLFEAVTDVAPDYAEGWHADARSCSAATATTRRDGLAAKHVILLNPRQFAAM